MKPNVFVCDTTLRRLGGDRELLQELITYFLEDAPALVETIRSGVEIGDREKAHRAAHNLRSLVANFDAKEAMASALALELAAKKGDLQQVALGIPKLEEEVDALSLSLQSFLPTATQAMPGT